MEDNAVLIGRIERRALAAWLLDEGFERPQTVHPQVWSQLHAEVAMLDFNLLGELCDTLTPRVLDEIRWPELKG